MSEAYVVSTYAYVLYYIDVDSRYSKVHEPHIVLILDVILSEAYMCEV